MFIYFIFYIIIISTCVKILLYIDKKGIYFNYQIIFAFIILQPYTWSIDCVIVGITYRK
jgi:hypothetical protein